MSRSAIGLIETRGLIGVIEAADVAAKVAAVKLLAIQEAGGGLATLRFSGDVASVQTAVDAATAAAERVSEVVGHVVIPSPHEELRQLHRGTGETVASDGVESYLLEELRGLPVAQLRQLVRQTPGVTIRGRTVSRANKEELVAELVRAAKVGADSPRSREQETWKV